MANPNWNRETEAKITELAQGWVEEINECEDALVAGHKSAGPGDVIVTIGAPGKGGFLAKYVEISWDRETTKIFAKGLTLTADNMDDYLKAIRTARTISSGFEACTAKANS